MAEAEEVVESVEAEAVEVETGGDDSADWRSLVTDEAALKEAERTTDLNSAFKRIADLRQQLSKSVSMPGENASDEDIQRYREQIGVPETYEFAMPEGREKTEADEAFHATASDLFHNLNISQAQAEGLNQFWNDMLMQGQEQQIEADKAFAAEQDADLRKEWGADYDANNKYADHAARQLWGDSLEDMRHLETKDGKFVLDHALMKRALAAIGRDMSEEGGIGAPMSESAREGIQNQIDDLEKQIERAQRENDRQKATRLYRQQSDLYDKMYGTEIVVGAEGRVI